MFTSCRVAFVLLLFQGTSVLAQEITVQFRPEKEEYQVGEPVFLVLDLVNAGSQTIRVSDGVCWTSAQFDIPDAPAPRGVSLYGCAGTGTAGSCLSGARDLRPRQHLNRRFLVEGSSRVDSAGIYSVHIDHTTNIYEPDAFALTDSRKTVSNVDVVVREGTREHLAEAYRPLVQQARSPDPAVRQLALAAIAQNPPVFLEPLLLEAADDPNDTRAVIPGLARLDTRAAKDKLAGLAWPKNPGSLTQPAIQALAELGDRSYCPVMLYLAQQNAGYSRMIALRGVGYLCGEKAIPLTLRYCIVPISHCDMSWRMRSETHRHGMRCRCCLTFWPIGMRMCAARRWTRWPLLRIAARNRGLRAWKRRRKHAGPGWHGGAATEGERRFTGRRIARRISSASDRRRCSSIDYIPTSWAPGNRYTKRV